MATATSIRAQLQAERRAIHRALDAKVEQIVDAYTRTEDTTPSAKKLQELRDWSRARVLIDARAFRASARARGERMSLAEAIRKL